MLGPSLTMARLPVPDPFEGHPKVLIRTTHFLTKEHEHEHVIILFIYLFFYFFIFSFFYFWGIC